MTWKTNNGKRILEGAEATVFASCLACMISEDVDDKGMNSNMPLVDGPFERLTPAQKYTVMEEVAQALFHESSIIPQLSAINESSIYYVFMWLLRRFESPELDGPKVWGPLILAAIADDIQGEEYDDEDEDEIEGSRFPSAGCADLEKWEAAIECLWDKILWDLDFEMHENPMFDADSGHQFPLERAMMHIDPEYFKAYKGKAKAGAKDRLLACVTAIPGVLGRQV